MAAPVVSSVSPNQGAAAGGTTVTVTGTSFTGATAVRFGSKAATSFTVNSSTKITAVSPSGTGTVNVTVTTIQGTSTQTVTFTYVTVSAPSLAGLSPSQGPVSGGTGVTLTGTNLSGATAVRFDGVAATSFTVDSATQITAVTPPHAAGATAVTVTTPGGTSNPATYVYLTPPTLLSTVPDQGPTHGGTVITLTGTNLAATTEVRFDTTPVPFTVVSPTQITAVAPAGTDGPVSVMVTTPAGTSNALTYTRLTAPGI
jgi:hypothetical protein